MDISHYERLRSNLQKKTTEELQLIVQTNDRREWTDEAFEAIRAILAQRATATPSNLQIEAVESSDKPGFGKVISGLILIPVGLVLIYLPFLFPVVAGGLVKLIVQSRADVSDMGRLGGEAAGQLTVAFLLIRIGSRIVRFGWRRLTGEYADRRRS